MSSTKKNLEKMKEQVDVWAERFDRNVLDVEATCDNDRVIVTMAKGSQLDSKELLWLIQNFKEVIIDAEAHYLIIHLFD